MGVLAIDYAIIAYRVMIVEQREMDMAKGVNLNPKTDKEALALLRWVYGSQVPAYQGK